MLSQCLASSRALEPNLQKYGVDDPVSLVKAFNYLSYPRKREDYKQVCFESGLKQDLELTISILRRSKNKPVPHRIFAESRILRSESKPADSELSSGLATTAQVSENLTDVTGAEQNVTSLGRTVYSEQATSNLLSLDDYFVRPIQIAEGALTMASQSDIELPVWDLYTKDPAVRSKLRNYAFFRANLHIRVTITGTPYHYGKLMMSYQPYNERNGAISYWQSNIAVNAVFRQNFLNYLSQSEGTKVLDIRENKPVEMVCPFISTKTTHKLFNDSSLAISDVTSFEDLSEAGSMYLYTINAPQAINATVDDPHYYVYAWMTDVELGPPTGTQVAIRTESKPVDERRTGPVEKFASGAVEISSALEQVPYISPMATASRIAFGALASVSAIFGWSKPIQERDPVYVKNVAFQNGANTIGYETNFKLTLDPKQELLVDGSVVGTDKDELVISELASRCSYLTTFTWDPSKVPLTSMFTCPVTPNLSTLNSHTTTFIHQPSAMMFAAQPFQFWRGDIEFTVEVVCSQFHRGKFAIIYEPNIAQNTLIGANLNLNKQYVKIIDIQETQTVTFRVNWGHFRAWCENVPMAALKTSLYTHSIIPVVYPSLDRCNGMIFVTPVTELVSPDGAAISVNVYVKCPNLRVNRFTKAGFPRHRKIAGAESKKYSIRAESKIDPCALSSQEVTTMELNESKSDLSVIALEHFGEEPVSFRALLKRYVTQSQSNLVMSASDLTTLRILMPMYPASNNPYGNSTSGFRTLYDYLRYGYVGVRGGTRVRLQTVSKAEQADHTYRTASMNVTTSVNSSFALSEILYSAAQYIPSCDIDATVSMDLHSNGGWELEFPYYANNKMDFAFAEDYVGSNPGGSTNMSLTRTNSYFCDWMVKNVAANDPASASCSFATSEDFCLLRFQGAPPFSAT